MSDLKLDLDKVRVLFSQGKIYECINILENIYSLNTSILEVNQILAVCYGITENYSKSVLVLSQSIELFPNIDSLFFNRSISHSHLDNIDFEILDLNEAIKINPFNYEFYLNRGNAYKQIFEFKKAIEDYNKAYSLNNSCNAKFNLAQIYIELNELDCAKIILNKLISINPRNSHVYFEMSNILKIQGNFELALATIDMAISINDKFYQAYNNKGNLLRNLNRYKEAILSYEHAIDINGSYVESYLNKGIVLKLIGNVDEAKTCLNSALKIKPDYAECMVILGNLLIDQKKYEESDLLYLNAFKIKKNIPYLLGKIIYNNSFMCKWDTHYHDIENLKLLINKGEKVINPFEILSLIDDPEIHLKVSQIFVENNFYNSDTKNTKLKTIENEKNNNKIRIGYFSSDFYNHATSHLIVSMIERHNKNKFDIYLFSHNHINDDMTERLKLNAKSFINILDMSDLDVSILCKKLEIDIAVDLKGFTYNNRHNLFSNRCAPIQINYLGYPGSVASSNMDYIIADSYIIQEQFNKFYNEKVMVLPCFYQPNDRKRKNIEKKFNKNDFNISSNSFVFCCFNNNYKISPQIFDAWIDILICTENTYLLLLEDNDNVKYNLITYAAEKGLDDNNRIIFSKRMSNMDHMSRHLIADLFLDTYPYNAHTTASDSAFAGLPILTISGQSFASRVAGSLLYHIQMNELICNDIDEYKRKAIIFATNSKIYKSMKAKFIENIKKNDLFNIDIYTNEIEKLYTKVSRI